MKQLRPLITLALLGLAGAYTFAQVSVRARLDSAAMLLGDPNRLVVSVSGSNTAAEVDWSVLDTMTQLVPLGEPVSTTAGDEQRLALPFSVYDSIGLLFPVLPVYISGETLYTNDLALLVDYPPGDTTLHPYRPLDAEPILLSDYVHWIIAGFIGLLLLAAALYFFYFARQAPKAVIAPPPPPAHRVALEQLQVLRKRENLDDKAYYSQLDRILRSYLEGRYEVPALEQTSGEVVEALESRGLPDAAELSALLQQVDLVKFAKAALPVEQRLQALDRVTAFVRATAPLPAPVASPSPSNPPVA